MAKKAVFSQKHSSLDEIQDYFNKSTKALNDYYHLSQSKDVLSRNFFGYNVKKIQDELLSKQGTLDRMCALETLAAIESRLRIDYLTRCNKKKKDDLSRKFRNIYKEKKTKASLENDIMKIWKDNNRNDKKRMDALGKMMKYRHWLAHGRYWLYREKIYNYSETEKLATDIFDNMGLFEN